MKNLLFLLVATTTLFPACNHKEAPAAALSGDVVVKWNAITVKTTKMASLNSNMGSRITAIEAIAVYDAVNSILDFGSPYHYFVPASKPSSAEAAAAQAAHDVLAHYLPEQQSMLDSALAQSLGMIKDAGIVEGQAVGSAAAADIIAMRENDGSDPNLTYPNPSTENPGQYRLTPPAFAEGVNRQWASVKPFVITSPSQFRPAAPPALDSPEYQSALAEVKKIGVVDSTARTAEQTAIAQFYKQDAELGVNEVARQLVSAKKSPLEEAALVFVLTDIATADARIAVWDAKYVHLFWRPITAINADPNGAVTNKYAAWTPMLPTPPHPSFPSGHSGTINGGMEVLKHFFGDQQTVTMTTTTAGVPPRTVKALSTVEMENGMSRIYGGIHFAFDNSVGQSIGNQVAAYVLEHGPRKKGK